MITCQICNYPSEAECDNPACIANPTLTDERRSAITVATERREVEEADRAMVMRAREAASRR
jgi:hypothetical protein